MKHNVRVTITNSHSNNRGDEAAQRSLVRMLRRVAPDAELTVLTAWPAGLDLGEGVRVRRTFAAIDRAFPFFHLPFILAWMLLRRGGVSMRWLARLYPAVGAMEELARADVVISAPGGPYIGDLYRRHEIGEHLLHLFIARWFGKPVMIYGPSMGPFRIRRRNALRRWILRRVQIITLRDPISAAYLDELRIAGPVVEVAADSAFQCPVEVDPARVDRILAEMNLLDPDDPRPLVGFTPAGARWNFKQDRAAATRQDQYIRIMAEALDRMVESYDCRVIIFPQLYGRNSDLPLIESIAACCRRREHLRILPASLDSDVQQAVMQRLEIMVGNRYHSVVFALKARVPTVCIAYEHKSVGVMNEAGLGDYVLDVTTMSRDELVATIDRLWRQRDAVRRAMDPAVRRLEEKALRNAHAVRALLDAMSGGDLSPVTIRRHMAGGGKTP